ncbi:MAG TPA: YidC/Oxa1 family membrane protein insertase [Patescibacteria group bacterium]|nr:YidC/Oxa1 family membrane protein insertase [Patescibacteria group bacterium]
MDLGHLYTIIIYQPFLNILVGIYWLLNAVKSSGLSIPPPTDMGVAVIIFTVIVRVILLPLTFSGERSEKERREIEKKIEEIEHRLSANPIQRDKEIKRILRGNRRIVLSSLIELTIQVLIALMLWRIFAKGLLGEDLHLIYPWMPKAQLPFNLLFLGKYDLTHPHMALNLLQSALILILETINTLSSPYKVTRKEVVRMQFTLPIFSFIIFAFLPAGKKLFVITALLFSIVYSLIRAIRLFLEKALRAPLPNVPVVEGVRDGGMEEQTPPVTQQEQMPHPEQVKHS